MANKHWTDYDGPTVGYMIDHDEPRTIAEPDALADLAKAALLAGLGSSESAARYQAQVFAPQPTAA